MSFTDEIDTYLLKTPVAVCEIHLCFFLRLVGLFFLTVQLLWSFITMIRNWNYILPGDKIKVPVCCFAGELQVNFESWISSSCVTSTCNISANLECYTSNCNAFCQIFGQTELYNQKNKSYSPTCRLFKDLMNSQSPTYLVMSHKEEVFHHFQ